LLNFALSKLSEEDRGIISLYYYEDMSTEEIAFATGMSQSNVKVRLFRTRQKLVEIIGIAEQNQLVCHEKI
jgi:RNA polymerase sigma factor (sigma-70 family)